MENRILTLHPEGKEGVNILQDKYDQVKDVVLELFNAHDGEITFKELTRLGSIALAENFDGKPMWYLTTVKLDLEARGMIQRVPKKSPQLLRLAK
ncbi:MAG: hypothetical protein AAFR61_21085 [Bacteroidota bacterium]